MCGLAGFYDAKRNPDRAANDLRRMLSRIGHRGPDDEGIWQDGPLSIGHRRLSIVDLSPLGHQPMTSASGRFIVALNGEIYNHATLRAQFANAGTRFRGHSDTEVLLCLVERDGLSKALQQCVGMFAIVLWDRRDRVLHLARDRFGEKPLYFGWSRGVFLFGSELKALAANDAFDNAVDPDSVTNVLRRGHVTPTRSIYLAYRQIAPGTSLSLTAQELNRGSGAQPKVEEFWSPTAQMEFGRRETFSGSLADATDCLDALLRRAVGEQLQADVPVGALLSGGVDSSITTALMCAEARHQVRSYSIGFRAGFDEAVHAKAVAAHLGTDHTEWYVDDAEALEVVREISGVYDEPLADSSQIPTLILARLVRQDVTVALSGDGADEQFGGYPKYNRGMHAWERRGRHSIGVAADFSNRYVAGVVKRWVPDGLSSRIPWHRLDTASSLYGSASPQDMAARMGTLNHHAADFLSAPLRAEHRSMGQTPATLSDLSYRRMAMLKDMTDYLPADILTKVDRATMAASLESRAPFLDHRIFEFASTLPESFLFDEGGGKAILRSLLYRMVPRHLVDRPKAGFSAPLGHWLRGSLRTWALDLFGSQAAAQILDVDRCRSLLDLHTEGRHDLSARIWPMLSVAAWAQVNADGTR